MKLYLIDWNNEREMIGAFNGDTLEQEFNTSKKMLSWSLEHQMKISGVKSFEIEFLKDHEELNKLREQRGLETKPTFDKYIKEKGYL